MLDNSSILVIEGTIYICLACAMFHAKETGLFNQMVLLVAVFQSFMVESAGIFDHDAQNMWYSQALIMLFNKQLPLFIIGSHTVFYYL